MSKGVKIFTQLERAFLKLGGTIICSGDEQKVWQMRQSPESVFPDVDNTAGLEPSSFSLDEIIYASKGNTDVPYHTSEYEITQISSYLNCSDPACEIKHCPDMAGRKQSQEVLESLISVLESYGFEVKSVEALPSGEQVMTVEKFFTDPGPRRREYSFISSGGEEK